MKEPARLRVTFTGRVQGVGFRAFVSRAAMRLGLTGWVENLPDGSVAAELQGERADIDALLAKTAAPDNMWINVEHISVQKLPLDDSERYFSVRER